MVTESSYKIKLISNKIRCSAYHKITIKDDEDTSITQIRFSIEEDIVSNRLLDNDYLKSLAADLNSKLSELHTLIMGRMNNILDFIPLRVSELKNSIKQDL